MEHLDFETIGRSLLSRAESLLSEWCPGGKLVGNEYTCASIHGGSGTSFKANIQNGKWADFATGEKGGDLVSLFAAANNLSQIEAAKKLAGNAQHSTVNVTALLNDKKDVLLSKPPTGVEKPAMGHALHGLPSQEYKYTDENGDLLYFIARYDFTTEGKKEKLFTPFSWDSITSKWVKKAWKSQRPIFGLPLIKSEKVVVIVEGEKTCLAAREILGDRYVVISWQGGSNAIKQTDWSPLKGRDVVVWPDADEAGKKAASEIIKILITLTDKIRVVETDDMPKGWDIADMPHWTFEDFAEWAAGRVKSISLPKELEVVEENQEITSIEIKAKKKIRLPESVMVALERCGVMLNGHGEPVTNADNVKRVLEGYGPLKESIWYDEFLCRVMTTIDTKEPRQWKEVDDINLMIILQREFHFKKVSLSMVSNAVVAFAMSNIKNEPRDWMDSLVWDEVPRIDAFFTDCMGCEVTEYIWSASKNFWLSMAARIYKPGCKVDTMICLDGPQGTFKSTALDIIGGKWFAESREQLGSKDFLQGLQGKMLLEISELGGFTKTDTEKIKATLSCRVDSYRASYGRFYQDYPRQCILVGTTNEKEIINDSTGGRRFWPITVRKVNLELIRDSRDQLFAEAAHRIKKGEPWWIMPIEETLRVQDSRRAFDDWQDEIANWVVGRSEVKSLEVAVNCLKMPTDRVDMNVQKRIGHCLKALGFSRKMRRNDSQKVERFWVKKYHQ